MKKILTGMALTAGVLTMTGCSLVDDTMTNIESDTTGLERTITIYSKTGEVLKQYHGKNVRIKSSENSNGIMTINIDGRRVQVMNADVIVEEKGAENSEIDHGLIDESKMEDKTEERQSGMNVGRDVQKDSAGLLIPYRTDKANRLYYGTNS